MIGIWENVRGYGKKVLKGIGRKGKGRMGWCDGLKVDVGCNDRGEIIGFVVSGGKVREKDGRVLDVFGKGVYGKVFGDKGYMWEKVLDWVFEEGMELVRGVRVKMKKKVMGLYEKMMVGKR